MLVAAGHMREQVIVQRQDSTVDGAGGAALVWNDLGTVWAEVKPLTANQQIRAKEVNLAVNYRVTIRWRDDLGTFDTNRYRLMWQGRPMRINGISNPDMRRRFLELICEYGQAVAS